MDSYKGISTRTHIRIHCVIHMSTENWQNILEIPTQPMNTRECVRTYMYVQKHAHKHIHCAVTSVYTVHT